jgi:YbbR domain-containing protein
MERGAGWLRELVLVPGRLAWAGGRSLRQNWGMGILSLVLALSLWVYVTDRENPTQIGQVPGAIPVEAVNVPADKAVFPTIDETVTVRVRASESVFEGLTADDFRATVDLSELSGDRGNVPVQVQSLEPRAQVETVSPTQIAVALEDVTSRALPIGTKLVGELPRGFRAGEAAVQPSEAVVSGPESLVARVDTVEADLNLTGVRTDFEQRLLLQARDERGGNIQGVDVAPESAEVRVAITQQEFSAALVVRPAVTGAPASGYNVTGIAVEPAFVVITGSPEVFQSIDAVQGILTDSVSVEGAAADVIRTVALQLPEGARVERPDVTVRITVAAVRGSFGFSVGLQTANVPPGSSATLAQTTVQVVLSGTLPTLSTIGPEEIAATLDLAGLQAGSHTVPVRVSAPNGTTVVSVTPGSVRVTVR